MSAPARRPLAPDPWEGASADGRIDLLRAAGITAETTGVGPQVDLASAGLCLVVRAPPEGVTALERLCGQHGALPSAPSWADEGLRLCSLWRCPPGLRADAINLHGTAPGLSVIVRGVVYLPPAAPVGSHQLRWGHHPAISKLRDLPAWLADAAIDPTAAHRAWDTAGRTAAEKTVLDDWQKTLTWERGKIARTHRNLCVILRSAPTWAGRVTFDEMASAPCLSGVSVTDAMAGAIRERIEDELGVAFGSDALWSALATVADERRVHPVREYLAGLTWDGTPRLDRVAAEILGATSPLEALFVRRWFLSAAVRALRPGAKVDTALVLVGAQGALKSRFFAVLAGRWFSDTHVDLTDKDAYLQLAASWVIEWGEFERVTSRRGADEIKAFLSSSEDRYRPPYGHAQVSVPRACVIVGSTNQRTFLDDETGSRRFWCVRVGRVDLDTLTAQRAQLWAEAAHLIAGGAQWWLDADEDTRREQDAEQHAVEDPWEAPVARWIDAQTRRDHTAAELLSGALDVPRKEHTKAAAMRLGRILRHLGWERRKIRLLRDGKSTEPAWTWVDTSREAEVGCPSLDDSAGYEPA